MSEEFMSSDFSLSNQFDEEEAVFFVSTPNQTHEANSSGGTVTEAREGEHSDLYKCEEHVKQLFSIELDG